MKRRIALLAAVQTCLAVALVAGAPAAGARTAADWTITQATHSQAISRAAVTDVSVSCPSGKTPVSGGYSFSSTEGSDARRTYEFTEFGNGQQYQVGIDDEYPVFGGASDAVTLTVNCMSTSLFTNSTTKSVSTTAGGDHLATLITNCDPGWSALSADVGWSTPGGSAVLTSTPDLEFDGWYARGYHATVGASMFMVVHCIPATDMPGARVYQHGDSITWGSSATATCATGLVPLTGGTYQDGGDGGALAILPRRTATGWESLSEGLGGGTMLTNVVCIPQGDPTVGYGGAAYPNQNSSSARWTFTVTDPAAAGDYGTPTTTCTVKNSTSQPFVTVVQDQACSSPYQLDNLADGRYTLFVSATTGDGRQNQPPDNGWEVAIDTTAPVITFDKPANTAYAAHAPSIPVHLVDDQYVLSITCAVDGGAPAACAQGNGALTLSLPSLADGTHGVRVTATDQFGNGAFYDYAFRVDTTAPSVVQKTPNVPFIASTTIPVTWAASDAVAGLGSFGLQWQRAARTGSFSAWSATLPAAGTATSYSFTSLLRGYTYCFHMRGTDKVANTSGWTTPRCAAIPLDDRDLADSSGWTPKSITGWFRGTAMYTKTYGASLAVTGVSLDRVGVVALKCSTCGVVGIYVGTTLVRQVDLHSSTSVRAVIPLAPFSPRYGTVKLKVLSTGKSVYIDGLGVSRT